MRTHARKTTCVIMTDYSLTGYQLGVPHSLNRLSPKHLHPYLLIATSIRLVLYVWMLIYTICCEEIISVQIFFDNHNNFKGGPPLCNWNLTVWISIISSLTVKLSIFGCFVLIYLNVHSKYFLKVIINIFLNISLMTNKHNIVLYLYTQTFVQLIQAVFVKQCSNCRH